MIEDDDADWVYSYTMMDIIVDILAWVGLLSTMFFIAFFLGYYS